jgi:hypothetical protein
VATTHKALDDLVGALAQHDPIHEYDDEHPSEWLVAHLIEAATDYLKWASCIESYDVDQEKARLLRIIEAILPLWDRAMFLLEYRAQVEAIDIDSHNHGC